jgi:2-polyprenyl-3-methyl-5-hydroxy-6-metoxy-1,4-benzoquinol methylase
MVNDLAARMKERWETISTRHAHLGVDGERQEMFDRYRGLVTNRIDVTGKRVIDFGMGGGLLGEYLLRFFNPAWYVGYDIAERSMAVATERLAPWQNKDLILLRRHRWSFRDQRPDLIVCLACIIHFPTRVYLENVLHEMNVSGAQHLVLEIRNTGAGTVFHPDPYSTNRKTLLACITTPEYVSEHLPSYELLEASEPSEPTHLQVLWYERR